MTHDPVGTETSAHSDSPDYAALAARYAGHGDLRRAQLAVWARDVHVLEELLWENGLADAPDPAAALAAVGESVAASLEEVAAAVDGPLTARAVVEAAREAMVSTFDASVHGLLSDRLDVLDVLDAVVPAASGEDRRTVSARRDGRDGRDPTGLAAELRIAAADCATLAALLSEAGEQDAAERLSRQAQAAAFESYLVEAALRAGDASLATVDLRWDLADGTTRDALPALVGTAEREALVRALDSVAAS